MHAQKGTRRKARAKKARATRHARKTHAHESLAKRHAQDTLARKGTRQRGACNTARTRMPFWACAFWARASLAMRKKIRANRLAPNQTCQDTCATKVLAKTHSQKDARQETHAARRVNNSLSCIARWRSCARCRVRSFSRVGASRLVAPSRASSRLVAPSRA